MAWFRIVRRRVSLKGRKAHYAAHKESARRFIEARVAHFASRYGLHYKRVFVRNQKSRWGSCSKQGNLNFHYRVAQLPEYIADYIIVHEICHLAYFDHSREFWAHVARAIPDHKHIRKVLRESAVRDLLRSG